MATKKLTSRIFPLLLVLILLFTNILPIQKVGATDIKTTDMSAEDLAQIRALSPAISALVPDTQEAYLKSSNSEASDSFGVAMSLDGDTLVIGANSEDSNATGVNGNGADNSLSSAGGAYVFIRNAGIWSQQAYLKASNTGAGDGFGFSVAISGDTIVVGATAEASNATGVNGNQADNSAAGAGAAYVFTRSAGVWSQQAYLKASNTGANDQFGHSVAISADTIVVGARLEDSNATGFNGNGSDNSASGAGAVYVFTRSAGLWSQQAYLKASNSGANDQFGHSVALSGDTLAVGAMTESSNATGVDGNQVDNSAFGAGAAYVFTRSGGAWSQQAYLKASNTEASDQFGISMAISGNTLVVGANFEDSNASGVNSNQADNSMSAAGAVYVFTSSAGVWSQEAYVKASNPTNVDAFGTSVAIYGDSLAVGANLEDSNATGFNGDQVDNSAASSGAVYVFARNGTTWSQETYTKSSNSESGDNYGVSLTLSADTLVVGAYFEDSDATGVNGSGANNAALSSGAAYAYIDQTVTLTLNSVAANDGWILESTETSGTGGTMNSAATNFNLGDDLADRQYRAILHFDTSSLPDTAVITAATLMIKKKGQSGTNPFTILGELRVDIRKPGFGTTALALTDFKSAAGKNIVAIFGTAPVGTWYSATINNIGNLYINRTGTTQFRLRFSLDDNNDNGNDFMKFYSGNAGAASRPQLIIDYYVP